MAAQTTIAGGRKRGGEASRRCDTTRDFRSTPPNAATVPLSTNRSLFASAGHHSSAGRPCSASAPSPSLIIAPAHHHRLEEATGEEEKRKRLTRVKAAWRRRREEVRPCSVLPEKPIEHTPATIPIATAVVANRSLHGGRRLQKTGEEKVKVAGICFFH